MLLVALVPVFAVWCWRVAQHLTHPPRVTVGVEPSAPRPRRPWRRHGRPAALALGVAGAWVVGGPVAASAALVAGTVVLPRWRRIRTARARTRLVSIDAPDSVDLLVALLHAGLTAGQAVPILVERGPASWRPGWLAVEAARGRGERFADALDELGVVLGDPATEVIEALTSAERYGHPLGPVLERLATESRAARRRQAEADARRLPVRLSFPLVCCTLPAFVLLTIAPLLAGAFRSLSLPGGRP